MDDAQRAFLTNSKWLLGFYATTPEQVRAWWLKNLLEMQRLGIVTLDENNKVIPSPLSDEIIDYCRKLTAKLEKGDA
jgi:hypothetical protein